MIITGKSTTDSNLVQEVTTIGSDGSTVALAVADCSVRVSEDTTLGAIKVRGFGEYETVAASQTAQVLGATGATGDYIDKIIIVPATVAPGNVLLLDNATSITVFAGTASYNADLKPMVIDLGMISVSGAWKITTGANVSVIAVGNFT